jgi:hypothetical protein
VLPGNDGRSADSDHDYQDIYARSTREIHCVPPLEFVSLFAYSVA